MILEKVVHPGDFKTGGFSLTRTNADITFGIGQSKHFKLVKGRQVEVV